MVFDEVDAGVGGTAALALAEALREVGHDRQVLVVTHLAQVAAFADRQISVRRRRRPAAVSTSSRCRGHRPGLGGLPDAVGTPGSKRAQAHAEELLGLATAGAR